MPVFNFFLTVSNIFLECTAFQTTQHLCYIVGPASPSEAMATVICLLIVTTLFSSIITFFKKIFYMDYFFLVFIEFVTVPLLLYILLLSATRHVES